MLNFCLPLIVEILKTVPLRDALLGKLYRIEHLLITGFVLAFLTIPQACLIQAIASWLCKPASLRWLYTKGWSLTLFRILLSHAVLIQNCKPLEYALSVWIISRLAVILIFAVALTIIWFQKTSFYITLTRACPVASGYRRENLPVCPVVFSEKAWKLSEVKSGNSSHH